MPNVLLLVTKSSSIRATLTGLRTYRRKALFLNDICIAEFDELSENTLYSFAEEYDLFVATRVQHFEQAARVKHVPVRIKHV